MKWCFTTNDENSVIGTVLRAVASDLSEDDVVVAERTRYRSQYRTRVATSVSIFRTGLTGLIIGLTG